MVVDWDLEKKDGKDEELSKEMGKESTESDERREQLALYAINSKTLALLPIQKERRVHTLVIEDQSEKVVRRSPLEIMKDSLKVTGTSYDEALRLSRENLDIQQKYPISVRTVQEIIPVNVLFPTESPTVRSNSWISFKGITGFGRGENGQLAIRLRNDRAITVAISPTSLYRQLAESNFLFEKSSDMFTNVYAEPTDIVKKQSALWLIKQLLKGLNE